MKNSVFLTCALNVMLISVGLAQSPKLPSQSQGDVVRVTTTLVQVDAVVTDHDGKAVTNVSPEDFEILEDGKPQKITNFLYVSTQNENGQSAAQTSGEVPKPFRPLSRENVKRTIAFVVDDLGMSLQGIDGVKRALSTFVSEQMQPGDLVAIARTRDGSGALYKFTEDQRQLNASITSLHWQCPNRVGTISLRPSPCPPLPYQYYGSLTHTITSLRYILGGLKAMPGRKALIFFTESFATLGNPADLSIGTSENRPNLQSESLPRISEPVEQNANDTSSYRDIAQDLWRLSNRASVVIYGVDTSGLVTINPRADDTTEDMRTFSQGPLSDTVVGSMLSRRSGSMLQTQQGVKDLAYNTGGLAIVNNNDLVKATTRIVNDLNGYYLIGYRPSDATFAKRNDRVAYHTISISLKRRDLSVRSRKGFYGLPAESASLSEPKTKEAQMIASLESPFAPTEVRLRLTPLFANTTQGSFVRTLIHVDARDLTFMDQPDGWHQTTFDVLASSYGESGLIADYLARTETIRARGRTYAKLLRFGLNYNLLLPIKKPGSYQIRTAVRDTATNHMGSAYQFIEVPDLKKGELRLSGIVLNSAVLDLSSLSSSSEIFNSASDQDESQPTPAVRRFKAGSLLNYAYVIYNAIPDRKTGLPQATAQARIFRDGELITQEDESPVDARTLQRDPKRIRAAGKLRLEDNLAAGQYVLQIVITDPQTKKGPASASQWIDFEVIK